jgi:hypothetical protein
MIKSKEVGGNIKTPGDRNSKNIYLKAKVT